MTLSDFIKFDTKSYYLPSSQSFKITFDITTPSCLWFSLLMPSRLFQLKTVYYVFIQVHMPLNNKTFNLTANIYPPKKIQDCLSKLYPINKFISTHHPNHSSQWINKIQKSTNKLAKKQHSQTFPSHFKNRPYIQIKSPLISANFFHVLPISH